MPILAMKFLRDCGIVLGLLNLCLSASICGFSAYASVSLGLSLASLCVLCVSALNSLSSPGFPQFFKFLRRLRPILLEQQRQRPIRQKPPASLATRTIIRLVRRIPNALNFCAADRAWTAKLPMDGHLRSKGRDILRKIRACLLAQKIDPMRHCFLSGAMETLNFLVRQFLGQRHWREPRPMKDFI